MLMKKSSWLLWAALPVCAFFVPRPASAAVGEYEGAIARGDFNGDGDEDLVVSSPQDDCGKGVIHIRSNGSVLSWTRDTPGVLGTGACYQYFGTALAVGDFDNDGYDDLAVSVPGASDTGHARSGAVQLFYGRSTGLSTVGDQVWTQDTIGVAGEAEAYDYMGDTLEVGDFNCDGYDDLVVGVPREDLNAGANAGAVHVLYGSSAGVSTVNDWWHEGIAGVNGAVEPDDHFGGALAAGNFNGDTSSGRACDDLAIASPGESVGSIAQAGYLYIMDGSTSGLSTSGDQAFHQDTSDVEGVAEAYDRFGERLQVIDDNGDGYDDLAISVPGDACLAGVGEGTQVMHGGYGGITTSSDRIVCNVYRCEDLETAYGCMSNSPAIFATTAGETFSLFVGDDEIWAMGGNDEIRGDRGDDVAFGGSGNDTFRMGPGAEVAIGGAGNDTFEIGLDCAAASGEVIDGGPGTDVVRSHLSQSELVAAGVTFRSIESFVLIEPYASGSCEPVPIEEGPTDPPKLELSWVHLPSDDDVYTTTGGELSLFVENTSDLDVDFDLTVRLLVRGWKAEFMVAGLSLDAGDGMREILDLNDFIPSGVDTSSVPASVLELPTSAVLTVQADTRRVNTTTHAGRAFAPALWGHHEAGEAKVYRIGARDKQFYSGDLVAWRANGVRYQGSNVFEGRIEARTVLGATP